MSRDIEDEPDWEAITTLDQFRERMAGRFGVIVIDDVTGTRTVHDRGCPFVSEENFVEKVLDNAGRNGSYRWVKNSRIAVEQLGARRCRHAGDRLSGS